MYEIQSDPTKLIEPDQWDKIFFLVYEGKPEVRQFDASRTNTRNRWRVSEVVPSMGALVKLGEEYGGGWAHMVTPPRRDKFALAAQLAAGSNPEQYWADLAELSQLGWYPHCQNVLATGLKTESDPDRIRAYLRMVWFLLTGCSEEPTWNQPVPVYDWTIPPETYGEFNSPFRSSLSRSVFPHPAFRRPGSGWSAAPTLAIARPKRDGEGLHERMSPAISLIELREALVEVNSGSRSFRGGRVLAVAGSCNLY
jgi:hypothetical protein